MKAPDAHAEFLTRLERHHGILLKVAAGYCRRSSDREDLVQEMLVQLWRAFPRYDGRASFATWTYRIALNVAISSFRERTRRGEKMVDAGERFFDSLPAPEREPEDERLEAIYAFIGDLDELNRALMILYLNDATYAEIADVLGITATNVATKIGRIKQKLRKRLWN